MSFFKKLFKNVIKDGDPKDDTVTVKGKPKPRYYGTVTPYPNFNASSDASVLQAAIKSKGVDEDVIIAVLVKRSNEQRQKIKVVYEASTGKSLDKSLKAALRSDLEDVSLALLMAPPHFDAHLLRKATKRLGTDEDVLVEVLATRSNQEIQELKRVFKEVYKTDLEDVIKDETSGDFTTALLAMLKANRAENTEVDTDLARRDAQGAHLPINTCLSVYLLAFQQYACISDITLPKALDMELKGDIEDCLTDIVKCSWNAPAFFAEKLHLAMKGHGTCEDTLIRVLVSRSEIDLKKILEQYRAMYDVSLQEDIMKDTKGHYRDILLGLCGPH
uniref:Annexin n=1 Tax=Dicentrarchus labrax TaxID=13489 RepID=A0A8C4NXM8_DICLA